jgi:hypothetical protein
VLRDDKKSIFLDISSGEHTSIDKSPRASGDTSSLSLPADAKQFFQTTEVSMN